MSTRTSEAAVQLRFRETIAAPYHRVVEVVRGSPAAWLPGSRVSGEELTVDLGIDPAGRRVSRSVHVEVGRVQPFGWGVVVPIEWRAARRAQLYPTLLGYLRLEEHDAERTRLRFDARYEPPGGRAGRAADRALLHRVARASVRGFFERLAGHLAEAART